MGYKTQKRCSFNDKAGLKKNSNSSNVADTAETKPEIKPSKAFNVIQEFCDRIQKEPKYEVTQICDDEYYKFEAVIKLRNKEGSGFGATEMEAKNVAAKKLLKELGGKNRILNEKKEPITPAKPTSEKARKILLRLVKSSNFARKNYVGLINELCQAKHTQLPQMNILPTLEEVNGIDMFVCTGNLGKLSLTGRGRSKREARQHLAKQMWISEKADFYALGLLSDSNDELKSVLNVLLSDH